MSPKKALKSAADVTYRRVAEELGKNRALARDVTVAVRHLLEFRAEFRLPPEENVEAVLALRALADLDAECDSAEVREKCAKAVSLFGQASIPSLSQSQVLDMIEAIGKYPYADQRASKARDFLRRANTRSMDEILFLMSLDFALNHLRGLHDIPEVVVPCDQLEGWIDGHVEDTEFGLKLLRYLQIIRKALGTDESGVSAGGKKPHRPKHAVRAGGFAMDPDDEEDERPMGGSRRTR